MKHRARLVCAVLTLLLVLSVCAPCASAANVSVTVDGYEITYNDYDGTPFRAWNGSVMLPVRRTMAAYGARLTEDGGACVVQLGGKEVRLTPGSAVIIVNGSPVTAQDAPLVYGGVLYAPAAELVRGLGGTCAYLDGVLAIRTQTSDSAMLMLENAQPISWSEANRLFQDGKRLREEGNYAAAAASFEQCIPGYSGSDVNLGMIFQFLGESCARSGAYDRAAAAYERAAYHWERAGNTYNALNSRACADAIRPEISVYLKTADLSLSKETTHGVNYEPERGTVLGYAAKRFLVDDPYAAGSAKPAGMWLIYYRWGVSSLEQKLAPVPDNVVVELAVEPHEGLDSVKDSDIIAFARKLHTCGKKVMVRYANEMNDPSVPWYRPHTEYPADYREGYIRFARLMRAYAPEVPLIWSPNFAPAHTALSYYPGDAYVDYVGASSYISSYRYTDSEKKAGLDVLGTGSRLQRWSRQIDFLYNAFGYRKPILISEGAAAWMDQTTGTNASALAAEQIRDFYTYLTIRYPNLKYAVWFNINPGTAKYMVTDNPATLTAYNEAISDARYLSDAASAAPYCYVPLDTFNGVQPMPRSVQELCAYCSCGDNRSVAAVRYEINGQVIGTATEAPYRVTCDFSRWFGTAQLRVSLLNASGGVLLSRDVSVVVGGMPDVDAAEYFALPVAWAVENGISSGTSAYTFSPYAPCTRGQVITFLWRAAGCPQPASAANPFTDVPAGAYYRDAVLWAVEKGITRGTSDTTFQPDLPCTRAQSVTFFYRAAGTPPVGSGTLPFTDVPADEYYRAPVAWALERGITSGTTPTTFSPDALCTRGQIVTFLYRAQ